MARRALLLAFTLAAWPLSAQPFQGQVGTPDQALLGDDWNLLRLSEMPLIPIEGVTVSVLDCGEACPDPVTTDASGWFSFPDIEVESALLRFDPPACLEDDPECEPLEPREEEFMNGSRTVLGAKWPAGVEDTVLRYMPLVAGTVYIKWEGEIPGLPGACGSASSWVVIINEKCWSEEFSEHRTFVHEIVHTYEFRLRRTCRRQRPDVNGWVLQEDWMGAYEADRRLLEEQGLPLREPDGESLTEYQLARETLAWMAEEYFTPDALTLGWIGRYRICGPTGCRPGLNLNFKTHRELAAYAPNRYHYFEKLVFERYLDEKQWRRDNPDEEEWPGMCEAPPFESESASDPDKPPAVIWPFAKSYSSLSYDGNDSPPVKCSLELH